MHIKSDSDVTSVDQTDQSTPPRSPLTRQQPSYFVQLSPSNHDTEKMSYGSTSPMGSPPVYYHCSPIHHSSRESSSTSRFSGASSSHKNHHHHHHHYHAHWKRLHHFNGNNGYESEDDDEQNDNVESRRARQVRQYLCFVLLFVFVFGLFCVILWGASKSYKSQVVVNNIVFESFYVQAGVDGSGVATDMLTLNSTVKIHYNNPGTFFGVHVTSTPLELHYYQLKVASGQIKKFYQARKSHRTITTVVLGSQVSLYGGISTLDGRGNQQKNVAVPLNLTFVVRSRAFILGRLVKTKFYKRIRCSVTLRGSKLGKNSKLKNYCVYH